MYFGSWYVTQSMQFCIFIVDNQNIVVESQMCSQHWQFIYMLNLNFIWRGAFRPCKMTLYPRFNDKLVVLIIVSITPYFELRLHKALDRNFTLKSVSTLLLQFHPPKIIYGCPQTLLLHEHNWPCKTNYLCKLLTIIWLIDFCCFSFFLLVSQWHKDSEPLYTLKYY